MYKRQLQDTTSPVEATFEQFLGKKSGKITIDPTTLSREDAANTETMTTDPVSYTHLDVYKRQGNFCPNCGSKKPEPKPAAEGWKCPQCGAMASGKFCPECGDPFDDGDLT